MQQREQEFTDMQRIVGSNYSQINALAPDVARGGPAARASGGRTRREIVRSGTRAMAGWDLATHQAMITSIGTVDELAEYHSSLAGMINKEGGSDSVNDDVAVQAYEALEARTATPIGIAGYTTTSPVLAEARASSAEAVRRLRAGELARRL